MRAYLRQRRLEFLIERLAANGRDIKAALRELKISRATAYRILHVAPDPTSLGATRLSSWRRRWSRTGTSWTVAKPRLAGLLRFFGVKGELTEESYRQARLNYLEMVKRFHPDTHATDGAQLAQVNEAWSRLKRLASPRLDGVV